MKKDVCDKIKGHYELIEERVYIREPTSLFFRLGELMLKRVDKIRFHFKVSKIKYIIYTYFKLMVYGGLCLQ